MKSSNIKLLRLFAVFFLIDLLKPFGYSLVTEFLFLGVIFVSLNENLLPAITISLIAGLLYETLNPGTKPLALLEFPLICFLNQYVFSWFVGAKNRQRAFLMKNFLVLIALSLHLVVCSINAGLVLPFFWIKFILQSLVLYLFIERLIDKNNETAKPTASIQF